MGAAHARGAALLCLLGFGCGESAKSIAAKVGTLIDEQTVVVGDVQQTMSLGAGAEATELFLPMRALRAPRKITVRLSKNVVKTGADTAGPCVQIADEDVMFEEPAEMRQALPQPPTGMKYMGVHADETASGWTLRADARVATILGGTDGGSPDDGGDGGDGSTGSPMPAWEMDIDGSGLWAMALVPIGTTPAADAGTTPADGDANSLPVADGGDPATVPQLTQLVPAMGAPGAVVSLEVHGRNITAGWSIVFDGKPVSTTIDAVSLAGVSDGNGALGSVTVDSAIATGQVPVWLASGNLRTNTLYFNVAPTLGAPTILDYTPDNGLPGTPISIIGRNLIVEAVTIRDPQGRVIPVVTTGTTTWVGAAVDKVDIVIPADMTTGVLTATNSKGSFRGRIFNVGQNLARLPGATAQSSTQYNTSNWGTMSGWDNNLQTSWFSANYDCATSTTCTSVPYFQVNFPTPQTVARIAMRGNREYAFGYDYLEGWFEVRAADGAVLSKAAYVLPQPDRDLDIVFPVPVVGASAVRFTSIADESVEPGFAELEVFGP